MASDSFVFSQWFQTSRALTLPVAFQASNFSNNFSTTSPSWLHVVTVADFNGDHMDDVVLSLVDSVREPYILLSRGDGTFSVQSSFVGDAQRQYIRNGTAVDLNKDGWLDFVGFESTHIMENQRDLVLLNNAGRGFTVATLPVPATQGHHGGAVGDFNGDGWPDILGLREFGYPDYRGTDLRTPLIQQADGSWKLGASQLPSWLEAYALAAAAMADLNGDGVEDLVLAVSTMAKDQSGVALSYERLEQTPTLVIAYGDRAKPLADWSYESVGRHWADVGTYAALISRFGQPGSNATAGANSLAVMDINQDGKPDLVAGSYLTEGFIQRTGGFQVFINTGAGFENQTAAWFPDQRANRDFDTGINFLYSLEDLNADGNKDFVITTSYSVNWPENSKYGTYPSVFLGQGDKYVPALVDNMRVFDNSVIGAYGISNVISGDFNGDGVPDLISLRNESDFDWNTPGAQSRTGYVVVSHLNKALTSDVRISATVLGTAADDVLMATVERPMVRGLAGDDTLQGRQGALDTAVYHGSRLDFAVRGTSDGFVVSDTHGNEGTDVLRDVERIAFSDMSLALDLSGNAGQAARVLGAVFGKGAVANPNYAGIAINLFDQGQSLEQVAQLAIDIALGPVPSSGNVVRLLWRNVMGGEIDARSLAELSGLIDRGDLTSGQLAAIAARLEQTAVAVDLAGLARSGWAYELPLG